MPGIVEAFSPSYAQARTRFLEAAAAAGPMLYAVAQILVRVPEGSSPDQVAALRKKAEDLLARGLTPQVGHVIDMPGFVDLVVEHGSPLRWA